MYLIYFDESGNTGSNLDDDQQPIFVLCALAVPETKWLEVEQDLLAVVESVFPSPRPPDFEIHATDLISSRRWFKSIPLANRLAFRDRWLSVAVKHDLRLIYRAIDKRRFKRWVHEEFGSGVAINPHVAAFPLVARVIDDWLKLLPDSPLGIFISDENKEIVRDVEKSIRVLRGVEGSLRLCRVIEKGFFIDSVKSVLLQLCDLCAFTLRKGEEARLSLHPNPLHPRAAEILTPIIHQGDESPHDVLAWICAEEKKKRPGTTS